MNESNWGDENLYNENVRILKKEVREDIRQWRDLPCHWTGRINVTKMARLPKTIYIFSATSIKIHMSFLTELEKNNPRILMELLKTTKAILSKNHPEKEPCWNYHTATLQTILQHVSFTGKQHFNISRTNKDLKKPFNTFTYIQLKFKEENKCDGNIYVTRGTCWRTSILRSVFILII